MKRIIQRFGGKWRCKFWNGDWGVPRVENNLHWVTRQHNKTIIWETAIKRGLQPQIGCYCSGLHQKRDCITWLNELRDSDIGWDQERTSKLCEVEHIVGELLAVPIQALQVQQALFRSAMATEHSFDWSAPYSASSERTGAIPCRPAVKQCSLPAPELQLQCALNAVSKIWDEINSQCVTLGLMWWDEHRRIEVLDKVVQHLPASPVLHWGPGGCGPNWVELPINGAHRVGLCSATATIEFGLGLHAECLCGLWEINKVAKVDHWICHWMIIEVHLHVTSKEMCFIDMIDTRWLPGSVPTLAPCRYDDAVVWTRARCQSSNLPGTDPTQCAKW